MNKAKLAVWIVVRDDVYYIDMAIKSVLPYVDSIYILDNGSTDGTLELIESFKSDKIFLEKIKYDFDKADFDKGYHTWNHPYWMWDETKDGNSMEAQTRNQCMKNCIEKFKPDWLIQLDADEVYTPLFFAQLKQHDLSKIVAIRHSTDNFITPNYIMRRPNQDCFDPHHRSWNPTLDISWKKTSKTCGHVAPDMSKFTEGKIWMDGIVHVHLHRTFGPKCEKYWGAEREANKLYNPKNINPELFDGLIKNAKKVNFNWDELSFVLEKWKKWGIV